MSKKEIFEGYLVFLLVYKGSKSERYAPVLITENRKSFVLYREDDNPFMNHQLRPYHFSYCRVEGIDEGRETIRVLDIRKTEDPLQKLWKDSGADSDTKKTSEGSTAANTPYQQDINSSATDTNRQGDKENPNGPKEENPDQKPTK